MDNIEEKAQEPQVQDKEIRKLLSPCSIKEGDSSHYAVDDLKFAITQDDTRNIAVTGNYGSGKSSVVNTCIEELKLEKKVLRISLSTFKLDEKESNKDEKGKGYEGDIEYKIVQHLLYKCDRDRIPYSGFQFIKHVDRSQLVRYVKLTIIAFCCYVIAFEPAFLQINSMYDAYHWACDHIGQKAGIIINLVADIVSICYLMWFLYKVGVFLAAKINRFRNVKIEAQGVSLEASTETSVFNKYLDEIIYIIQANQYDFILFEDLDRVVNSTQLFLKIRELNMLINESEAFKNNKRIVRFIYAIKDDVFNRELRTKCFDYIVAVVPVVDHYNVIDYLIAEYRVKGMLQNISDAELEQITNRITGLRELKNVMNEYSLYERSYKLHSSEKATDYEKKLLAIIVYKNLFPQDFGLIYEKKGLLYSVINQRHKFDSILTHDIKEELVAVEGKIRDARGKIVSLRRNYLDILEQNNVKTVRTGEKNYTLEQVANNDQLWNKFVKNEFDSYYYVDEANDEAGESDYNYLFKDVEKDVNADMGYDQFARNASSEYYQNYMKKPELEKEIREIEHTDLRNVFRKAGAKATKPIIREIYDNIYEKTDLTEIPQIDVIQSFVYNGYIEEDYYLYISKFYPGTLSEDDYQFANDIIQGVERPYDTKLNNVEAIVKKLRKDDFENRYVLNFDILEYLMRTNDKTYLPIFIETVRKHPDFIVKYYQGVKSPNNAFFHDTIEGWIGCVQVIQNVESDIDREQLLVLFFMVAPTFVNLTQEEKEYLEGKYEFLCNNIDKLKIGNIKDYLHDHELKFKGLVAPNEKTRDLYNYCLTKKLFVINEENLKVILGEKFETGAIFSIMALENKPARDFLEKNLSAIISLIPDSSRSENKEAIVYLLKSQIPSDEWLVRYLSVQSVEFDEINDLDSHSVDLIIRADKLIPAWHLVQDAFKIIGKLNASLYAYLTKHASKLMKERCVGDQSLVQSIHQQLFAGDELPINEFKQLMRSFDYSFSLEELKSLSDERISEVIKQKKIAVSAPIFEYLNKEHSAEVADDYFILHFDSILDDDKIELSNYMRNSMGIHILNSKLTLEQKKRFMDEYLFFNEKMDDAQQLAALVCFYYNKCGVKEADHDIVVHALQLYHHEGSWEQKINLINKCNAAWVYDHDTENKMLNALGGEYDKLTYARGWANYDIRPENWELLDYLKSHGHYVNKFDEKDGQYYVTFKHS